MLQVQKKYIINMKQEWLISFFAVELNFWGKYLYAVYTIEAGKLNWEYWNFVRFLC